MCFLYDDGVVCYDDDFDYEDFDFDELACCPIGAVFGSCSSYGDECVIL